MLKNKFIILCQKFSKNDKLITQLWEEIETAHGESRRHYHTLAHLKHIYKEFENFTLSPLLEFSIFYHDIVYDASRNDNEEQSAYLAQKQLKKLTVENELHAKVFQLIIETKTHKASCNENKLFLDADLSILGSNEKSYAQYSKNIRKEYAIYENPTYNKGRKKVLKMLLNKERIYESGHFYELYENTARKNLERELNLLCSL